MASAGLSEELSCSICLSIYTNPVMLTCGHNFCKDCITSSLDSGRETSGIYTCPECRAVFNEHPSLQRNLKLCNIVEHFLSTQPKPKVTEVFCTYCVSSPVLAVKTCLLCEASLCDIHLGAHSKSSFHVLIEPTASMEGQKCSVHNELFKYFCYQDSAFLCGTCSLEGNHNGHQVELLNDASEKMKVKLLDVLKKITLKKDETEKDLQRLRVTKQGVQAKAAGIKDRITALFNDIREELTALENKILSELMRQEQKISLPLTDKIQKLEIETKDLYKKILQTKELCSNPDPLTLLKDSVNITAPGKDHYRNTRHHLSHVDLNEERIAVTLQDAFFKLLQTIPELKEKRGFHVCDDSDMILNVNTANLYIALSQDLRKASYSSSEKSRPHHPERFTTIQVLSTRKFSTGKHYLKVQTSDIGNWSVGLTYNSVKRKGNISYAGKNNKSWCINFSDDDLTAEHDNDEEDINSYSCSSGLGVYLDYEGGILSFYELSKPIKHLHTFTASFTEPLYAVFYVHDGGWIRIGD
ncbi:E3 ubiquitin/ISG15 ligase TRIM25-like [Discoglossus pictus]